MLRHTVPDDTSELLKIADETHVFKPMEIQALREVLDDYHDANAELGHIAVTCEVDGRPAAFAYYAPAAMTERTWYLYWIAVTPALQSKGIGAKLLRKFESDVAAARGRLLLIETSSQPHYEPTRRFYLKHAYEVAAVLSDYYADNDDMVVFRKRV